MSDNDAVTPRVFIVRHGETEWAKSGRLTSTTEAELTDDGIAQVSSTASLLVGAGKFVDPSRLARVFVSPRNRARKTLDLLLPTPPEDLVTVTADIEEWNYGDYEGLKKEDIINLRWEKGLEKKWDIYQDGCEGGESTEQIAQRLDKLISEILDIQKPYMNGGGPANVLVIAHGLILRCLAARWVKLPIDSNVFVMTPGAIGMLSYKPNDIEKRVLHVGLALPPANTAKVAPT